MLINCRTGSTQCERFYLVEKICVKLLSRIQRRNSLTQMDNNLKNIKNKLIKTNSKKIKIEKLRTKITKAFFHSKEML